MPNFVGIDPGVNGGIVKLSSRGEIDFYESTPLNEGKTHSLYKRLGKKSDIHGCMVEFVHSRPNQSSSSTFTFGMALGLSVATIWSKGVKVEFVLPKEWQSFFNLKSRGETTYERRKNLKEDCRLKAKEIFPGLPIWESILTEQRKVCDALLIAEYCRLQKGIAKHPQSVFK